MLIACAAAMSTLTILKVVVSVWAGASTPGQLVAEAGLVAEVGVAAGVDVDPAADALRGPPWWPRAAPPRGRRARWRACRKACSRTRTPASRGQPLPDDLEVLGVVGDAGPGAVGVGPLDDRPQLAQAGHHVVGDAPGDLERPAARGVEAVEGVQDGRARAAQEALLLDRAARRRRRAPRRWRRRRPRSPRPPRRRRPWPPGAPARGSGRRPWLRPSPRPARGGRPPRRRPA